MTDLVDRLASHRTLKSAPRDELAWLAAHGSLRDFAEGAIVNTVGTPLEGTNIVLEGRLGLFLTRGTGRRKLAEERAGDVTGLLPYSRGVTPIADVVALEPTTILMIAREDLAAMMLACRKVTEILVHKMLDRSRDFTSISLHDEKLVSLGRLAAGLAHELNNPVSAIARNAALLEDRLDEVERAAGALEAAKLADGQRASIAAAQSACAVTGPGGLLSPIERADREEAIAGWLARHGVGGDMAAPLADTAVTLDALERLANTVTGPQLDAVLRWAAAGSAVRGLATEIREAAMRIAGLVTAVKGFTHMDQAVVAEPIDLVSGLNDTIAVLHAKAQAKSASIVLDVEANLPRVHAFAGELNQIWANLIDNALDAVAETGRVAVTATLERDRVVVRVIDDGPGIPPEIRAHIFDPFFTTKGVGLGKGLGLDIVRRLVRHNDAEIDVASQPGRTEFSVSLPITPAASLS